MKDANKPDDGEDEIEASKAPLMEHLIELRTRLIKAVAAFLIAFMVCFYFPFWYFGHCLSYLNGFYLHYGGNPDVPIAWGVSSYNWLYKLTWFNNGYHAEHHFRPSLHSTKMKALHKEFAEKQKADDVRVIRPPHALGFLDPDLPPRC